MESPKKDLVKISDSLTMPSQSRKSRGIAKARRYGLVMDAAISRGNGLDFSALRPNIHLFLCCGGRHSLTISEVQDAHILLYQEHLA